MNNQNTIVMGEGAPLTNWKNPPTLANLKQDYMDAKPIHDEQKSKISGWLDNLRVTGAAKIKATAGNSTIVPKLIRKQAEWRYAALSEPFLSTENLFTVKPKTWEDRKAAQQNMLLLNSQFNTAIDKVRFLDSYVRAAVDEGTVVVRVGWEFEEEEVEEKVPVVEFRVNPEMAPIHEQLMQLKESSPSQYALEVPEELRQAHDLTMEHGQPIEPVVTGSRMVTKTKTVKNWPTVEVAESANVVFDPTCQGDMNKCSFAIESFDSSLAELGKTSSYKNLDRINLTGSSILNEPDHVSATDNSFNFNDKPRKRFVVYQYWGYWDIDGTGKLKAIVAAWVGNTLIRLEENPFPDKGIPFITEQYLPVRQSLYGEPDGVLIEDNQRIMGAVTRGMIDVMGKSANGQTGMRRDMLDATNRRKFDKGQDYEFNANVDPRQGVFMHTYPEIPQSATFMLQLQSFEAESLTGVKSYSGGISGSSLGDVAAGVRGALDAASKRELAILRRLKNGIVKTGRKIISMNSEFLSDEEVVRLTNETFVPIRKDDLAGHFDLELSISTAEEDNNKAEQLSFMMQTNGNNMDADMRNMIMSDIARLRKMPELAEKLENYAPEPDPIMQEKMQLENELLKAQIAKENAQAQHYASGAGLQTAKVTTEQAKATNLQSDTDIKNLDFVEQESGVKQERAKELHGEQARSQLQSKLAEQGITQVENDKDRQHDLLKEYIKARKVK